MPAVTPPPGKMLPSRTTQAGHSRNHSAALSTPARAPAPQQLLPVFSPQPFEDRRRAHRPLGRSIQQRVSLAWVFLIILRRAASMSRGTSSSCTVLLRSWP